MPLPEFYYTDYIHSSIAISEKGEIFVLLPRRDSVSIIRLNFYRQFDPLVPGAVAPTITTSTVQP